MRSFEILRGQGHFALRSPAKSEICKKFRLHPLLVGAVNCSEMFFLLLDVAEEEEEED